MAEKIKYTEKELKQPDKFTQIIASAVEYIAHHFNRIAIIVGAVILILIVGYFLSASADSKKMDANNMFSEAEQTLSSGDMEGALAQFQVVAEQYPGEKISVLAMYEIGIINFNAGNYDESVAALQKFIDKSGDESVLRDSAILTQGLASYQKGDWQKAVDYLIVFEDKAGSPYETQAKTHLAKAYEKTGDKDKADVIKKQLEQQRSNPNAGYSAVSQNGN